MSDKNDKNEKVKKALDSATNSLNHGGFGTDERDTPAPVRPSPSVTASAKMISLTIDDINVYAHNPRKSVNPKYDEIKESIRAIGLENPLTVTKRPGDSGHTLYNGGNTRLKILKELYKETRDDQFYYIDCRFMPFTSDSDIVTRHMIENESRGEMLLVDKAMAAYQIKTLHEQETGENLSLRTLSDLLAKRGWAVGRTMLSTYMFVAEHLYARIPVALNSGLSKRSITQLQKTYSAIKKYIDAKLFDVTGLNPDAMQEFYLDALSLRDSDDELADIYALRETCEEIAKLAQLEGPKVQLEINYIVDENQIMEAVSTSDKFDDLGRRIDGTHTGAGGTNNTETAAALAGADGISKNVNNGSESPSEPGVSSLQLKDGQATAGTDSLGLTPLEQAGLSLRNQLNKLQVKYPYLESYFIVQQERFPFIDTNSTKLQLLDNRIQFKSHDWDFTQKTVSLYFARLMNAIFLTYQESQGESKNEEIENAIHYCHSILEKLKDFDIEVYQRQLNLVEYEDGCENYLTVIADFRELEALFRAYNPDIEQKNE